MLKAVPLPPESTWTPVQRSLIQPDFPRNAHAYRQHNDDLLDAEALMAQARVETKLEDFGKAPLEEPFRILCRSINDELLLSRAGYSNLRLQFLGILKMRLRLEQLWQRVPEILEIPVRRPIFILGLPRSGTTMLHRLLSCDPGLRSSPFWEQMNPLPFGDPMLPVADPDPRIGIAEQARAELNRIAPDIRHMHEIEIGEPEPDIYVLTYAFASKLWEWQLAVPQYTAYYHSVDHTEGYRYLKKVLQTLQWLRGGDRWLLKSPQHMELLGPLRAVFPDALLIQTHRDCAVTAVSVSSLTAYGVRTCFVNPNPVLIGQNSMASIERLLRSICRDRDPQDPSFIDVQFNELMADPIGVVGAIHAASDTTLTSTAERMMRDWLGSNRRGKHGIHRYTGTDFGIDVNQFRERTSFYSSRFNVPAEQL